MNPNLMKMYKLYLILLMYVLIVPEPSNAQDIEVITGVVNDGSNQTTIPGVNVLIKGTNSGTSTGADGAYSIKAKRGDVIIFSYIGYLTQEITVGNENRINVRLAASAAQLNEVVVTALGIKRESKSLTYAAQQLSNSDLTTIKDPSGNIMNSLNGKIAGAVITPLPADRAVQ